MTLRHTCAALILAGTSLNAAEYQNAQIEADLTDHQNMHSVSMIEGPIDLSDRYWWHELFGFHDIGYFFESEVGLIGDNETQYISFEMNTNTLFEDPYMHMVFSISGDSFVRTNESGEITQASDVQLGGRGLIIGRLDRPDAVNSSTECVGGVEGIGIEHFSANRGLIGAPPIPLCESWDSLNLDFEPYTDYKFEVAASRSHVAYYVYEDIHPFPNIKHWDLIHVASVASPELENDHYYGNVIIGAAGRSSTTSFLDISNMYVGKFGAEPAHVPEIDSVVISCQNDYCATLRGTNFDADASVLVRKDNQDICTNPNQNLCDHAIVEFSGNDIYRRQFSDTEDLIFFPIQSLDLQDAWNDEGLCFTVKNSLGVSNEVCRHRTTNPVQPKFMGQTVQSYNTVQDREYTSFIVKGNASPLDGGHVLKLMGNSWKAIDYDYKVTASTTLTFDFRSNQQEPEINGVGLVYSDGTFEFWQVYGTQNYKIQDFHNYSGSDYVSYQIPVGLTKTGTVVKMFFAGDEDTHVGQNTVYRSPMLQD